MGGDILLTSLVFERLRAVCLGTMASPDWRARAAVQRAGRGRGGRRALPAAAARATGSATFEGHPTSLLFLCGANDEHVPKACAEAFAARLLAASYSPQSLQQCALPSAGVVRPHLPRPGGE